MNKPFKINEDAGFVADQILEQVNREANIEWGRSNYLTPEERMKYYQKIIRDYKIYE